MSGEITPVQSSSIQSMTADIRRVLVCPPRNAGWDRADKVGRWRELGFHRPPEISVAESQHGVLCRLLREAGAEIEVLPETATLTLDAVYVHDATLPTDYGLILMNPGKSSRVPEARAQAEYCAQAGIPVLGEITVPGKSEAGDIVWLDSRTLLVGQGYRTNRAGIEQMRQMLSPKGVEVISAPLPYGPGPSACLHLMSLISMLDEETMLVDRPWLAVETVELLERRGFRLLDIDANERSTLACNVLALRNRQLIAIDVNCSTNQRLRDAGFEVLTFPGSEICINGSGGPTCLTRPLLRRSCEITSSPF
jgi:N-dimethylarginine dimethylaminohydrolase